MNIEKIHIKNYRGFEDLIVNFKKNINVFVGVNGAGKSSILDLIASFLNNFTIKFSGISSREIEYNLTMLDINIDKQETVNQIFVSSYIGDMSWELKRDFRGGKNNFRQMNSHIVEYQRRFEDYPNLSVPIFKYFQSQRNSVEKSKSSSVKKRYIAEQFKVYEDAFDKTLEFDRFISWFVEEENIENRRKVTLGDLSYKNPKINMVRRALTKFFGSFKSSKYENLRVEVRDINLKTNERSSLVIDKNGKTFNLKQLSDGEKMLILVVADIAHRLSLANPQNDSLNKGAGIVLIDEIDLHLHPAWQREVIPCLLSTFPDIQFITTTHSPQVLSSVDNKNIFIIEDFKIVEITPPTLGNDSNTILGDLFDVSERPVETQKEIDLLYDLIEDEKNERKTLKLLKKLENQLGKNNPEIIRAKLHYEFQKSEEK